jgi:hypothetical protein
MSILQGNNTVGFTQNDPSRNRRISDKFSSSHSYAPACKCNKNYYESHLSNDEEKI